MKYTKFTLKHFEIFLGTLILVIAAAGQTFAGRAATLDYDGDNRTDVDTFFASSPSYTSFNLNWYSSMPDVTQPWGIYDDYLVAVANVRRVYCDYLCDLSAPW